MTQQGPNQQGGLVRPEVTEADAERIAVERYGIQAAATELGSNQDRNFLLIEPSGARSVLRVDNPVFGDAERDAQHAGISAYLAADVRVAAVLPGIDGELTQRWDSFAVRRSEFAEGTSMLDAGYLAPVVLEEFGAVAAASVNALAELRHPGLERAGMWDMRVAYEETVRLAPSIVGDELREAVLRAAETARLALAPLAAALPVQAIHGDLTDDNVMGTLSEDARLHPRTLIDLGDLGYGWRVAELAVCLTSLLPHDSDRPLRVLDAIAAFHRSAPLSVAEARAVWPLVVLRAALLIASGHRQLEIEGGNAYARERIAGEQAMFDSARRYPLHEMTEQILSQLGYQGVGDGGAGLKLLAAPRPARLPALKSLLPDIGSVATVDPGVESETLGAGAWLEEGVEERLVERALQQASVAGGSPSSLRSSTPGGREQAPASPPAAAILPYGVYRLTRTAVNAADAAATWPVGTEIAVESGAPMRVTAPGAALIAVATERGVLLDLENGWHLSIDGVRANRATGDRVRAGDEIAVLDGADVLRAVAVTLCRTDAIDGAEPPILSLGTPDPGRAQLVVPERVPAWRRLTLDPAVLLGLESLAQRDESEDELLRRERIFATAQERYYERPMQIERGWRHHLVDTTGRSYVDMVNNVTGLGHGHPGVSEAVNRQIRLLGTNSRFLYRELAEYSERLLAMLPVAARTAAPDRDALDTVLLVNSGSEAVDLALRLVQAATGRKTVVALREAYHGWTMASDAVTTSAYDNPYALENRPDWTRVADVPNRFRGTYRGAATDLSVGERYAADLSEDLASLGKEGRDIAGFICESVLGNAGGVMLPEGYLASAYERVRAAGGLCIADEVQVGFGRMGSSFWGFEQSGVVPDLITIAKPMGNGFPIGGVITSKRVADALATQGQFFASAGGNPVSCRVGIAVLDAMREEGLQENARIVGQRLSAGFAALADRHELVGPIHGEGLYLGVELVRDRKTMEPAKHEAAAICERLRELGVIVLTTSERSNVLKIKPPLCLTAESADFVVAQLDRVLSEGW